MYLSFHDLIKDSLPRPYEDHAGVSDVDHVPVQRQDELARRRDANAFVQERMVEVVSWDIEKVDKETITCN